ncbi:protease complex subunit PrcB family protein [uncultured Tenacibaculum sp.]|uniref:protease complex subunit PrcB family protein n=1 Tax=uncultured Tenacibaculum sp. TaxID=174713 RepID=UPI002633ACF7|nr:protease complex subunit PrcB family protein [uncultured Tenacibaculum sp.]
MNRYVLLVLMAIMTLSCNTNDDGLEGVEVRSTLIADDVLYGAGREGINKENFVITNTNDWDNLAAKMNAVNNATQNFTETDIDFSKYTVIAVFDEVRPTGGYDISLEIKETTNRTLVKISNTGPSIGSGATTVVTQPYVIRKIQKTDLPVVFN